jgi:hypothetical protein
VCNLEDNLGTHWNSFLTCPTTETLPPVISPCWSTERTPWW